jgi:tetratricopeptide (TPR) repeat protein
MGAVYHAWDDELGVAVALKVILPQLHDAVTLDYISHRFKQELLLARQITHKNVVRIHDIGEVDGIKFISMPYISGEDLAGIMKQGPMPIARALNLARQIAAGLGAAHEAGVVHRDLKPGNVMVQEGDFALLMDFGIARSVRGGTAPGTIVGTVVGTLEYMPPEQARGEVVDGRADVYAFGLIFYEMLTGLRKLGGEGAMRDLVTRMNAAPAPVRTINSAVPEAVDAIVTKCLQPAPDLRFQGSSELLEALSRLDAEGRPLPEKMARPAAWKLAVATVILALVAGGATRLFFGGPAALPPERDPVSVLIADFENKSGDPVFDGALEDALTLAIEEAAFITTFPRATAGTLIAQQSAGAPLDESGARLLSQREGIKVVLAGSIETTGRGYRVTVRALDAIPGTVMATATENASSKGQVLAAVANAAAKLREALGDTTTETAKLAAAETFTAASLDAAREYSRGQELHYAAKYDAAIEAYRKALEHDPQMGRAYAGWALNAAILGRTEEAESKYKEALARLDRMTEREKFRTLGTYYNRVARDPEKAIENFAALVAKYPADASALNNLAVAYFRALDFANALEYGRRLVTVYPKVVQWRYNYALYAMYAGDFEGARTHAEAAIGLNADTPKAYLALATAALAGDKPDEAVAVWDRATASGAGGASLAAIGVADLGLFRGRAEEAIALLEDPIAKDENARNTAGVAQKLVARGEAYQMLGRQKDALTAVQQALALSRAVEISVPAARVMLAAGRRADALKIAADLRSRLPAQPRAYANLIEAEAALLDGSTVQAVESLRAALKLADLWLVRYVLGVAYVQAGAYPEAMSELEACEKRRGEASAVFLNDVPSWRYTAPLHYWLARARDGIGLKGPAMEGFRKYLALRGNVKLDPLRTDAQQRLGT